MEDSIRTWLLAGDPAIRWQVLRDPREQRRIAKEGWGAQFLQHQDPDGRWAHGIYNPKWTSTTYTLVLLRSLGLEPAHPQAIHAWRILLDTGFWRDSGINFYPRRYERSETCISSMVLAVLTWFGLDDPRVDQLAQHVVE